MDEVYKLKHALNLAREDLWFLLNYIENLPEPYLWRATGTALFATQAMGDAKTFNLHRDKWITEGINTQMIRNYLAKIESRYQEKN